LAAIPRGIARSGEAVAVAFHGRPRTRFFGQPTAGLADSNSTLRLPDGAIMNVMSAVDVDRNGQRFGEKVMPDETIDGTTPGVTLGATLGTMNDPVVVAATRWVSRQTSCRE
jgi:C-terminal processing protease CtpA/Prc